MLACRVAARRYRHHRRRRRQPTRGAAGHYRHRLLGAGKSTLVQRILSEEHGSRILVIENELGEVGVDHELLLREAQPEEVVLLSNGCVCCRVRKDLITTLLALRDKLPLLDACLIETTGVADPAALVQTFYAAELRGVCRLDAVLCVVDAKHVRRHLELPRHCTSAPTAGRGASRRSTKCRSKSSSPTAFSSTSATSPTATSSRRRESSSARSTRRRRSLRRRAAAASHRRAAEYRRL